MGNDIDSNTEYVSESEHQFLGQHFSLPIQTLLNEIQHIVHQCVGGKNTCTSPSVVKLQAKWNKSLKQREKEGKVQGFRIPVVL